MKPCIKKSESEKSQPTEWKKIFVNRVSDKGHVFRINKEYF
jgi:hypothetical protein